MPIFIFFRNVFCNCFWGRFQGFEGTVSGSKSNTKPPSFGIDRLQFFQFQVPFRGRFRGLFGAISRVELDLKTLISHSFFSSLGGPGSPEAGSHTGTEKASTFQGHFLGSQDWFWGLTGLRNGVSESLKLCPNKAPKHQGFAISFCPPKKTSI